MAHGEPKQVIIMRTDLRNAQGQKIRTGKLIAQGSHASLKAILDIGHMSKTRTTEGGMDKINVNRTNFIIPIQEKWDVDMYNTGELNRSALLQWLEGRFTKVCVSVDSEEELLELYNTAREAGLLCSLIKDAGLTEFNNVPTITCAAIGPAYPEDIDPITGHLKLL